VRVDLAAAALEPAEIILVVMALQTLAEVEEPVVTMGKDQARYQMQTVVLADQV
jgi:hypothetical protein